MGQSMRAIFLAVRILLQQENLGVPMRMLVAASVFLVLFSSDLSDCREHPA